MTNVRSHSDIAVIVQSLFLALEVLVIECLRESGHMMVELFLSSHPVGMPS